MVHMHRSVLAHVSFFYVYNISVKLQLFFLLLGDCIGCLYPIVDLKLSFYYLLPEFVLESVPKDEGNDNSVKLTQRCAN